MFLFYNIVVVPIVWLAFQIYGTVNAKARRALEGRRRLFEELERDVARLRPDSKRVWFHSSSMGEFEQAKPIIAELRRRHPEVQIIVSFFSPSGYEHSRSYKLADVICYIPFDSWKNARRFRACLRPSAAIILRYDVWPNHIWALQRAGIPTFIASATLRRDSLRHVPLLRWFHRALYNSLDYILTVSEEDRTLFAALRLGHPVLEVVGDSRYDQVVARSEESKKRQLLPEHLLLGRKVFVVGSSWTEDEVVVLRACEKVALRHPELLVVVVPHEPTIEHLERLEDELDGCLTHIRFSELVSYGGESCIIVDSVGILMSLYQHAHIAYVGGSFGSGVHNVLEPAAYGVPIIIGPVHENSQEAATLVRRGAIIVGHNEAEMTRQIELLLTNDAEAKRMAATSLAVIREQLGATRRFLSYVEKVL